MPGMRPRFSVFIAASLDGFIARADGAIDWLSIHALDQEPNGYDEFVATVDAIVIGRGTYETALGFGGWPYGNKRVIVLTHGARDSLHGEELFAGEPAGLVPRLAGCKRVYVDGGKVISQFFAADLVDDVTVGILPIVLGGGIRLFPGGEGEHRLALEGHRVYRSGMVQVEYRVQRPAVASAAP
jgi:dihydrofolate reductase